MHSGPGTRPGADRFTSVPHWTVAKKSVSSPDRPRKTEHADILAWISGTDVPEQLLS